MILGLELLVGHSFNGSGIKIRVSKLLGMYNGDPLAFSLR